MIKEISETTEKITDAELAAAAKATEKKRAMLAQAIALNKKSDGMMDFLAWGRCIDELENQIIASKQTIQINEAFLAAARQAQIKLPTP